MQIEWAEGQEARRLEASGRPNNSLGDQGEGVCMPPPSQPQVCGYADILLKPQMEITTHPWTRLHLHLIS